MTKQLASLFLGTLLITSCATSRPPEAAVARFNEENNADIVIRHYTDEVNRVLKPLQMEGPFLTALDKGSVRELAAQQAGRELAVVILLQCNSSNEVKKGWAKILTEGGYKRVVFLRAECTMKINGLPVLDNAMSNRTAS